MTAKQLNQFSKAALAEALLIAINTSLCGADLIEIARLHDLEIKARQWGALGSRLSRGRARAEGLARKQMAGRRLTSLERSFTNAYLSTMHRFKQLDPIIRPHVQTEKSKETA